MRRWGVLSTGAVIATFGFVASPVTAQQVAEKCAIEGDTWTCRMVVSDGSSSGVETVADSASKPVYRYEWSVVSRPEFVGSDLCGLGDEVVLTWVRMSLIETGEVVHSGYDCRLDGDALADPPPPPPSSAEVMAAIEASAPLSAVEPQLMPSPFDGSPVQLDLWGWCENPGVQVLDLGPIRGWGVTATMEVVNVFWSGTPVPGDDPVTAMHVAPQRCGVKPHPSSDGQTAPWHWTPHQDGTVTITTETTWAGEMALKYDGAPMGTTLLDEHRVDAAVSLDIYEIEIINN